MKIFKKHWIRSNSKFFHFHKSSPARNAWNAQNDALNRLENDGNFFLRSDSQFFSCFVHSFFLAIGYELDQGRISYTRAMRACVKYLGCTTIIRKKMEELHWISINLFLLQQNGKREKPLYPWNVCQFYSEFDRKKRKKPTNEDTNLDSFLWLFFLKHDHLVEYNLVKWWNYGLLTMGMTMPTGHGNGNGNYNSNVHENCNYRVTYEIKNEN